MLHAITYFFYCHGKTLAYVFAMYTDICELIGCRWFEEET